MSIVSSVMLDDIHPDIINICLTENYCPLLEPALNNPEIAEMFKKDIEAAVMRVLKSEDIHNTGRNVMISLPPEMVEELLELESNTGVSINQHIIGGLRGNFGISGAGTFEMKKTQQELASDLINSLITITPVNEDVDEDDDLISAVPSGNDTIVISEPD